MFLTPFLSDYALNFSTPFFFNPDQTELPLSGTIWFFPL